MSIFISPFTEHQAVETFSYTIRDASDGTILASETGAAQKTISVPYRSVYQVVFSNMAGYTPGVVHFMRIPESGPAQDGETYYANPTLKQPSGEPVMATAWVGTPPIIGTPYKPPEKKNLMIVKVLDPRGRIVQGAVVMVRFPDKSDVMRETTKLDGRAIILVPQATHYYLEILVPGYPPAKPVLTGKPLMAYDVVMTPEPSVVPVRDVSPTGQEPFPTATLVYVGAAVIAGIVLLTLAGGKK